MSQNSYHVIADGDAGVVFKTRDNNQRRRLLRKGWTKERRDELDKRFNREAMARLAEQPDGQYKFSAIAGFFVRNDRAS